MRTVGEFKNFLKEMTRTSNSGQFCSLSPGHLKFWKLLNDLGWQKKTIEPELTQNIDFTAPLSDEEWYDLVTLFRQLKTS